MFWATDIYLHRKSRGGVKKSGTFGWWGPRPVHNFRPKNYHFLFLRPFNPEASKSVKTHKNLCVQPYLGAVKDRLSSWLCGQTLNNNFGGNNGKNCQFWNWSIIFPYSWNLSNKIPPTKTGSRTTTGLQGVGGKEVAVSGTNHPKLPLTTVKL